MRMQDGKCWCDTNGFTSSFYNKEEELFEVDNKKIN
jgi:hypothetical protein